MLEMFGPSLKLASRAFRKRYGSDDDLLAKTNDLIRQMDAYATGKAFITEAEEMKL